MSLYLNGHKLSDHFTDSEYNMDKSTKAWLTKDSIVFVVCIEEFRRWLGRPMTVTSWFRSEAVNKAVGGISTSNHLRGCAMDWTDGGKPTATKFVAWSKRWAAICKKHGVKGESGLYSWGYHFGIQNAGQIAANYGRYVHWDSRTGTQYNNPFRELNSL